MSLINGTHAPAGRLPVTQYPASYTELPMTDMNLRPNKASNNPGRTYMWYPDAVQPFGTGLHYTTFKPSFSDPHPKPRDNNNKHKHNKTPTLTLSIQSLLKKCNHPHKDTCPLPPLEITVTNTGGTKSDYVPLAFVSSDAGPKPHPIKALAAYGRLRDIAPGKTASKALEWTVASLVRHEKNGDAVLWPGTYRLVLDVEDGPGKGAEMVVKLTGKREVVDRWPVDPGVPAPVDR
jgi:beta-D-xylosidase 4